MVFDTAAGELAPDVFARDIAPDLDVLARAFPQRLGYYAKGLQPAHLAAGGWDAASPWAGLGLDWHWDLAARSPRATARASCRATSIPRCCCAPARDLEQASSTVRRAAAAADAARPPRLDLRPWARGAARHAGGERPHVRQSRAGELRMTTSLTDLFAQLRRAGAAVHELSDGAAVARARRRPTSGSRRSTAAIAAPDATLSVYVHLPFCESLCTFCGCNTVITRDHGRSQPYVRPGAARARRVSGARAGARPSGPCAQMHLGGGTPTFLPPDAARRARRRAASRA